MSAVAVEGVPRETTDAFGGLVRAGETPEEALRRLEKTKGYAKVIGSDEGQRLLAAATDQVETIPNGGLAPRQRQATRLQAEAHEAASVDVDAGMAVQMVASIPIGLIDIGPNVRVNVAELDELTASIQVHGVLQPIKVRPAGARYTIVWGQRRFLAARQAGLATIPALVDLDHETTSTLAIEQLVENLHRADLPPLDRARAMRAVVDAGMSQADLARELGINHSTISNDLGLLEAPASIQTSIEAGQLTPSHAKALKGLAPKTQQELAKESIERGYSAHRLEEEVQRRKENETYRQERAREQEAENRKAVERLVDQLGNLAKKKVPLDARVIVASWSGTGHVGLVERIRALGYTNVAEGSLRDVESRSATIGCDCKVWRVEQEYNRLAIVPGCVNDKHQQAKTAANEQRRRDKNALERAVHAKLEEMGPALVGELVGGGVSMGIDVARMFLWHSLDYRLGDWAVAHGGKSSNPWPAIKALSEPELRLELGMAIATAFRDRYGYHVPWAELATELGVDEPTTDQAAAAASS